MHQSTTPNLLRRSEEEHDIPLDALMHEIYEVNNLAWKYAPLSMAFNFITKFFHRKNKTNIYMVFADDILDLEDAEAEFFCEMNYTRYERRKPENEQLRLLYDKAKSKVRYYMMPKTDKIEQQIV